MKDTIWQTVYNECVVEKKKYSKLSVRAICQKVGIHHTSFYYHFEDKEAVFKYGIGLLMSDYLEISLTERYQTPFSSAERFFANSSLQNLIISQIHDLEGSHLITKWTKAIMVEEAMHYLESCSSYLEPKELTSRQLVETIFTISEWSQEEGVTRHTERPDDLYLQYTRHLTESKRQSE